MGAKWMKVVNGDYLEYTDGNAGLDIQSNENVIIPAHGSLIVSTGLHLTLPKDTVGLLWSRSGLSAKHKIEVGAGCIDECYTGEIKVVLFNHSIDCYHVDKGDRIAQLLIMPIYQPILQHVDDLKETSRGGNGFGSSGK